MATERTPQEQAAFMNRLLAAEADLEASARYRRLAELNPTLRRDYTKRAQQAEVIGKAKLAVK